MDVLFSTPLWLISALYVVIPSVLGFIFLLWLMRKWILAEKLKENHDVAGFTFGIIGVLYSVILGFTVVNAQTRYSQVLETIHMEALMAADLYREAVFFSEESKVAIRKSLRDYIDYVTKIEWKRADEQIISKTSQDIMEKLWKSYYNVELKDDKMKLWYNESISKLDAFMNARLSRQFASQEHLGTMMWTLLIIGAIITICFMFFFWMSFRSQIVMITILAGFITFMLYLVYSLDHVFEGSEGIKPDALEQVVILFDRWDETAP